MDPIKSAAVKVLVSGAIVAVLAFRIHRGKRPREWWGLVRPALPAALAWIALYLGWMALSDALTGWRGPWDFRPWQAAPVLASAMRVIAVCALGPIAEELVFRGLLFGWLRERIGVLATILLTAAGWSLLHVDYSWQVIAIIFVDGLLLGLARQRTGSVYVPIAMHMLYNLYAIW